MRRLVLVWLAACTRQDPQQIATPAATALQLAVSEAAVALEPVQFGAPVVAGPRQPPVTRLWTGRPGAAIAAVFATEDGSAAASIDVDNRARLWPSLDGTREPWVLPLTMPTSVALARSGDGFAVAALDEGGGLEVLAITGAGELTAHARERGEPGFAEVHAVGDGFVALRRDQTLVQLDARGAELATLLPPPGEHVERLLHRRGRVLALVRRERKLRGRWIAAGTLAWGDLTPRLKVDPHRAFLSPDHRRVLTLYRETVGDFVEVDDTFVIELATGRARPVEDTETPTRPVGLPIGFSREGEIVFAESDLELATVEWWSASGHRRAIVNGYEAAFEHIPSEPGVATDGDVVMAAGMELAVAKRSRGPTPSTLLYLGYRTLRASRLRGTPAGLVAHAGGTALMLDHQLRTARQLGARDAIAIDDQLALARLAKVDRPADELPDRPQPVKADFDYLEKEWRRKQPLKPERFVLYDLERKRELQQWPVPRAFHFEPATGLLALHRGSRIEIARLDRAAARFTQPRTFAGTHVALLDPARADGQVAVLARQRGATVEVRGLHAFDGELRAPRLLAGKLEAIDRRGRVYVREAADTVAVLGDAVVARLTGLARWRVRPHPSGTHVAAFARNRLALFDMQGEQVWSIGLYGIRDAVWTEAGELFALAGDIVKLDLADGSIVAARCGWAFGLRRSAPQTPELGTRTGTHCDR